MRSKVEQIIYRQKGWYYEMHKGVSLDVHKASTGHCEQIEFRAKN